MIASLVVATLVAQPLLFGEEGHWAKFDPATGKLERFSKIGRFGVQDAAMSPEHGTIAFISRSSNDELLYLFREGAEPVLVGDSTGFYADPSFSPDGRSLFFAHHEAEGGGPPGKHAEGAYAQLFRMDLETRKVEQLTNDPGCKMTPQANRGGLLFSHADCHGLAQLEWLVGSIRRVVPSKKSLLQEPAEYQGRILTIERDGLGAKIVLLGNGAKDRSRVLYNEFPSSRRIRPSWADSGKAIYFQDQESILKLVLDSTANQPQRVASIGGP